MELVRTLTGRSDRSRPSVELDRGGGHRLPGGATETWVGHFNRLTEEQQKQLAKFKVILEENNLYTFDPPSHDEPTVIRYLRARKWDIQGALAQFKESETVRKDNMIDKLYETIDVDFYERARVLYPQWTGHRDRRGLPVYVYQIKHLDQKTINDYAKETAKWKKESEWEKASLSAKLLPLYGLYQNMLTLVLPICSSLSRPAMDVPITQGTNIVDVSGVGIKTFWNLKGHMQEASTMATAHFPETLDKIFIIGAPYFFPTVWGWIKRWFDPITVSKIYVLSKAEMKPTLEKYFEPSAIPKVYGGQLEWEFGQLPAMDPEVKALVGHEWIKGPARWHGQYVPYGTVDGKQREQPPPIPEDQRIPLWRDVPKVSVDDPTATAKDSPESKLEEEAAANDTTGVSVGGAPADHPSVENQAPAEVARVAIPEEPTKEEKEDGNHGNKSASEVADVPVSGGEGTADHPSVEHQAAVETARTADPGAEATAVKGGVEGKSDVEPTEHTVAEDNGGAPNGDRSTTAPSGGENQAPIQPGKVTTQENKLQVNGIMTPSEHTEPTDTSLIQEKQANEKLLASKTNGIAKPILERFETAAEILPNGTA